jgi:hypothetical protein
MCLLASAGLVAGTAVLGGAAASAAPSKARSAAFARAVNLVAADLPGFAASSSTTTQADKRLSASLAKCAGAVSPSRAVVNKDSLDFTQTTPGGVAELDAGSNVTVVPSSRLAAQDLRAIRSKRGQRCLTVGVQQLLKAQLKGVSGVTLGHVSVTAGRQTAPGASGSFIVRLKVTATVHGVKLPFYLDSLGFTLGPAEVGLTTLGIAERYPAADEQRLFALLLQRAEANHL